MSSSELMLALSNEVERSERYSVPSALTRAGQVDRRNEEQHVLVIREYERQARERVAAAAVETTGDIAWIQGRARANTDAKFAIDRAQKESALLGGEDPIKQAKFAILDDEFFAEVRSRVNRPAPHGPRMFPS